MPPSACPKLREVRDLMAAAEGAAKMDRVQREVAAIQNWHDYTSHEENEPFFQLRVDLRGYGRGAWLISRTASLTNFRASSRGCPRLLPLGADTAC